MQLPIPAGDTLVLESAPIDPGIEPTGDFLPGGIPHGAVATLAAGVQPVLEGIDRSDPGEDEEHTFQMLATGSPGVLG